MSSHRQRSSALPRIMAALRLLLRFCLLACRTIDSAVAAPEPGCLVLDCR